MSFFTQQPSESGRPSLIASVTISRMRHSDIEAVARLESECQSLPWSANVYVTELNNPNAHYCIAKTDDGELAGYGGVWVVMDEMHITNLVTRPSMRCQKIGERVLIRLIQEGIRRGAQRATLEVRESNFQAHNLYLKYAFQDVAMRKRYYSDNNENAIIRWAEDLTGIDYQEFLRSSELELFPMEDFSEEAADFK
jgi:ribosomal-protein-alanine N-acetyltransferase